ncbi:MAG: hypothetical protein JJU00_00820 [Opitutales bacterium]|nr:hypothetical protein [Opitutales bacterium]
MTEPLRHLRQIRRLALRRAQLEGPRASIPVAEEEQLPDFQIDMHRNIEASVGTYFD